MHTENFAINIHNCSEIFGSNATLTRNAVEDLELQQRIYSRCLRVLHWVNACMNTAYDT